MSKLIGEQKLKDVLSIFLYLTLLISASYSVINSVSENGKIVFIKEPPIENEVIKMYAQIAGAVSYPGIYEIENNTKVGDIISMAGGTTNDLDISTFEQDINLVRKVEDGEKITIPITKSFPKTNPDTTTPQHSLININTGSIKDLDTLPGVGEVTAQKIIDNRPFNKVEELVELKIITQSRFNDLQDLITL